MNLNDTGIISGCIGLLRQYTEDIKNEGKGLLSHSFGFYCFRALVLGIQVGVLSFTGEFDSFIDAYHFLTNPEHVSAGLAYIVNDTITRADSRSELLDPRTLSDSKRMFLKSVGGVLNTDVGFLLEALWKDRDVLTYLATSYPLPGWASIIWLIGQHMIWSLELQTDEVYEWNHLRELCFRYSLFATPEEMHYLANVCDELQELQCFNEKDRSTFLVDQADGENVLKAYISCMNPSNILYSMRLASQFIGFILQGDLLKPAHLMTDLVEAMALRIWEDPELLEADRSMAQDFIVYCTGVFEIYGDGEIVHRLREAEDDKAAILLLESWDTLLQSLNAFAYKVPREIQQGVSVSSLEWEKMRNWLSIYPTVGLPRRMLKYIDKCRFIGGPNVHMHDVRTLFLAAGT
ncbi:hypothetical protein FRC07_006776, partial [Ceratobasidium sp. 392]